MADTSIKSPDCGWISPEKLAHNLAENEDAEFLRVAPDFVAKIRSLSDSISKLKRKMQNTWMKNGVRLGWLIDPYKERVFIYREGKEVEEIKGFDGKLLSGEEVMKDFELNSEKLKISERKNKNSKK